MKMGVDIHAVTLSRANRHRKMWLSVLMTLFAFQPLTAGIVAPKPGSAAASGPNSPSKKRQPPLVKKIQHHHDDENKHHQQSDMLWESQRTAKSAAMNAFIASDKTPFACADPAAPDHPPA